MRGSAIPFEDDGAEFDAGEGGGGFVKDGEAVAGAPAVVDAVEIGGAYAAAVGPGWSVGVGGVEPGDAALGGISEGAHNAEDQLAEDPA